MENWKTTVGGILASVGTALTGYAMQSDGVAGWVALTGTIMAAVGVGLLGYKSTDSK